MSFAPLATTPIAERLRAQVAAFRTVGEAADVATVQASQAPVPCAYVLLASETGSKRLGASGVYRQRTSAVVAVLLGVRVYGGDATEPGAVSVELSDLVAQTRTALLAWVPDGADTVIEFVDGRVLGMDDQSGMTWWLERYRCDYWLSD